MIFFIHQGDDDIFLSIRKDSHFFVSFYEIPYKERAATYIDGRVEYESSLSMVYILMVYIPSVRCGEAAYYKNNFEKRIKKRVL